MHNAGDGELQNKSASNSTGTHLTQRWTHNNKKQEDSKETKLINTRTWVNLTKKNPKQQNLECKNNKIPSPTVIKTKTGRRRVEEAGSERWLSHRTVQTSSSRCQPGGQEEQGIDLYEGQFRGSTWGQFLRIYAAGIRHWRWQRPSEQPAGDKADRPMMLKLALRLR